jgi:hypothetical protein
MPCCGLTEYRQKVPLKYTISGAAVFWGVFTTAVLVGLLTAWSPWGRQILHVQASFLQTLWIETMRRRDSVPAHWSCRMSGRMLTLSPRLAQLIYRHPELPFVYAPVTALALVTAAVLVVRSS